MYAHFYAHMRWTSLPIFALLLFLGTFLAVVVRVVLASRRKEVDVASGLIFDENETIHPVGSPRR